MRKFGQAHRSRGICREIECANPAARLRLEITNPPRSEAVSSPYFLRAATGSSRGVPTPPLRPLVSPRLLSSRTESWHPQILIRGVCARPVAGRSRCRDGQPLSVSASSVRAVSTRLRLQIGMIRRCDRVFGTPQPHRCRARLVKDQRETLTPTDQEPATPPNAGERPVPSLAMKEERRAALLTRSSTRPCPSAKPPLAVQLAPRYVRAKGYVRETPPVNSSRCSGESDRHRSGSCTARSRARPRCPS
jgi:hypothetical protein